MAKFHLTSLRIGYKINVMQNTVISAALVGEKWLPYREAVECECSVHSVFNRVVNVSTGRDLLSVAAGGMGGSSAFLTLPGKRLDFGAPAGGQCVLRSGRLHLANHTIDFSNSALWKGPIPAEYRYNKKIKEENIAAFKAVLDRKAAPGSAWRCINSDVETRFSGLRAIRKLRQDPSNAQKLIGLGPGLTPSGDDMLLGFLAVVNHVGEDKTYIRALSKAVSDSLHRTTDISAQALKNALDCDYHEFVQNCIRDVCEGEKEAIYISAASLLSVGATSGSDIACGMYFGMSEVS